MSSTAETPKYLYSTNSNSFTTARPAPGRQRLGSEIGWTSLDQRSRADFEEYTGVAANPDNIRLALSKGVLTTTETLRAILEKEQRERMEKEEIEKCTTCTKGCDHKRLPKAINMPYLDQIGGARRRGGGDCREDLRTVVSEGIPRQIVGGFQKVEEEAGEGEGQTPFSIRSQGEGERQVFFVEKGGKEVCGVEEEERVRAKCNQSPKLEGGLSYDRQEGSKAEGGEGLDVPASTPGLPMRRKAAAPRKVEWTVTGGAADTTVDLCPQKLRKLGDCSHGPARLAASSPGAEKRSRGPQSKDRIMVRTRNAEKRHKVATVELALFNPDVVCLLSALLDAQDLCQMSLTCKALGAKRPTLTTACHWSEEAR
ncbi:hypothetical protein THAOC_12615, partial [Thalassiosira oceanica]